MKLSELAERTGARADEKDSDIEIRGAAGLDEAEAGHVTFLANPRYTPRLQTTRASAVYVGEGVEVGREDIAALRAPDPYLAYTRALRVFHPEAEFEPFIHPSAAVDPTARLRESVPGWACAFRRRAGSASKTTWRSGRARPSAAPRSARRAWRAAPRSTTSCRSATPAPSARTRSCARRSGSPAARAWAGASSSRARSASRAIWRSATTSCSRPR